jgi:hypothetical protein
VELFEGLVIEPMVAATTAMGGSCDLLALLKLKEVWAANILLTPLISPLLFVTDFFMAAVAWKLDVAPSGTLSGLLETMRGAAWSRR